MIKYFVNAWEDNKGGLRKYFKTHKQENYGSDYDSLLGALLNVINGYNDINFKTENIKTIDYGNYQGTLIITFAIDTYQPTENETFYTVVDYGSCSGCDTLLAICDWDYDKLPTEKQIDGYMELCLHMIQNIKCFGNLEYNDNDNMIEM